MILSQKDIYKRCQVLTPWGNVQQPMIWPFVDKKVVHSCGCSYGLSGASYDLRLAEDVVLPPNPAYLLMQRLNRPGFYPGEDVDATNVRIVKDWMKTLGMCPSMCQSQLAYTLEYLTIPDDVCGFVVDKSTYARRFVSAMNTLFDPGFQGHGVLELVNLGPEPIVIMAGEPVCQMVFHKVSEGAAPYRGKYHGQTAGAHGARFEQADGSWK